jgi:hypothetical protein
MKTQEEIEKMARDSCPQYGDQLVWISGYEQCQEDMADKKYTEKDMLKCWNYLMAAMTSKNPVFFKDYINSLNKQD